RGAPSWKVRRSLSSAVRPTSTVIPSGDTNRRATERPRQIPASGSDGSGARRSLLAALTSDPLSNGTRYGSEVRLDLRRALLLDRGKLVLAPRVAPVDGGVVLRIAPLGDACFLLLPPPLLPAGLLLEPLLLAGAFPCPAGHRGLVRCHPTSSSPGRGD